MNGEKNSSRAPFFAIIFLIILIFVFVYSYIQPKKIVSDNDEIRKVATTTSIKALFVGDMMLDRNVRNIIARKGFDYFFAGVKDVVRSADISVANLEGPFTSYESITADGKSKALQFTFDPSLASALLDFGFDIVGLANNHTLNFGQQGLEMTRRYIGSAGISYYGDPNNGSEISTVMTKHGVTVGLVGFHEFSYLNYNKIFSEVERLRPEVDVLVVSPHWGNEYETKPTEKQRKWARQFIDSGADVVIGTHSHVVGENEEYNGKKIFYSLGNFAFDQYFSKATMEGLGVMIDIEKGDGQIKLEYTLVPFEIDGKGVRVATSTAVVK